MITVASECVPSLGVAHKISYVQNFPFRFVGGVVGIGTDKHVAAKQRLPGRGGNDFDRQVVIVVRTHVQVLNPARRFACMCLDAFPQGIKTIFLERSIHAAPVNRILAGSFPHYKAIRRGTARSRSSFYAQSACIRKHALAERECHFD